MCACMHVVFALIINKWLKRKTAEVNMLIAHALISFGMHA